MVSGMTGQLFQLFGSRRGGGGVEVRVGWDVAGTGEGVDAGLGVSVGMIFVAVFAGTKVAVGAGVDSPVQAVTNRQTNKDIKNIRFIFKGHDISCPYTFHTVANFRIRGRM